MQSKQRRKRERPKTIWFHGAQKALQPKEWEDRRGWKQGTGRRTNAHSEDVDEHGKPGWSFLESRVIYTYLSMGCVKAYKLKSEEVRKLLYALILTPR